MNKFLTYFLLVVMTITIASCSSDKNDEPDAPDSDDVSIIGIWEGTNYAYDEIETYVFRKNGTYTFTADEGAPTLYREEGRYIVSKSLISNNDILTLTSESLLDPRVFTILKLTKNKLVMRYEGSYEADISYDDEESYYVELIRGE